MTAALIVLAGGMAAAYLVWRRLPGYLREFQQEGYEPIRFLRSVTLGSLVDPAVWLAVVCRLVAGTGLPAMSVSTGGGSGAETRVVEQAIGLGISVTSPPSAREIAAAVLFVLGAVALAWLQPDHQMWRPASAGPGRSGNIPPTLAPRAIRIRRVAFVTCLAIQAIGQIPAIVLLRSAALEPYLFLGLLFAALPLLVLFANMLLGPYERGLQHTLEREARLRISEVKPPTED